MRKQQTQHWITLVIAYTICLMVSPLAMADGGTIHIQGHIIEEGCAFQPPIIPGRQFSTTSGQRFSTNHCRSKAAASVHITQVVLEPQPYLATWQVGGNQYLQQPRTWQMYYLIYD